MKPGHGMETMQVPLGRRELVDRLASLPEAFLLRDEERSFCGAFAETLSSELDPEPGLGLSPGGSDWPRWVGVLPYEAFRGLERGFRPDGRGLALGSSPVWARYDAVGELVQDGLVLRGTPPAVERLARALEGNQGRRPRPGLWLEREEPVELHERRIVRALAHIARGDLYQVNLARRSEFRVEGHPLDLFSALGALGDAPFAAALDLPGARLLSASPELCLRHRTDGSVLTRPIKGTRPRGSTAGEDRRLVEELSRSEKEQAELAMVVDIERNDLGRIAAPGTVRMSEGPHIVSHATVHHREAAVVARLRPDVDREALLKAMLPSGSVTGAPKIRAMELIAELEAERRGLYTGALGYLAHNGSLHLSMAIRVLSLRGEEGHYFSGGGIVADSDPRQEVEETRWKAAWLASLMTHVEN